MSSAEGSSSTHLPFSQGGESVLDPSTYPDTALDIDERLEKLRTACRDERLKLREEDVGKLGYRDSTLLLGVLRAVEKREVSVWTADHIVNRCKGIYDGAVALSEYTSEVDRVSSWTDEGRTFARRGEEQQSTADFWADRDRIGPAVRALLVDMTASYCLTAPAYRKAFKVIADEVKKHQLKNRGFKRHLPKGITEGVLTELLETTGKKVEENDKFSEATSERILEEVSLFRANRVEPIAEIVSDRLHNAHGIGLQRMWQTSRLEDLQHFLQSEIANPSRATSLPDRSVQVVRLPRTALRRQTSAQTSQSGPERSRSIKLQLPMSGLLQEPTFSETLKRLQQVKDGKIKYWPNPEPPHTSMAHEAVEEIAQLKSNVSDEVRRHLASELSVTQDPLPSLAELQSTLEARTRKESDWPGKEKTRLKNVYKQVIPWIEKYDSPSRDACYTLRDQVKDTWHRLDRPNSASSLVSSNTPNSAGSAAQGKRQALIATSGADFYQIMERVENMYPRSDFADSAARKTYWTKRYTDRATAKVYRDKASAALHSATQGFSHRITGPILPVVREVESTAELSSATVSEVSGIEKTAVRPSMDLFPTGRFNWSDEVEPGVKGSSSFRDSSPPSTDRINWADEMNELAENEPTSSSVSVDP